MHELALTEYMLRTAGRAAKENGAKKSYTLADDITLNILYQKYYEEEASDENDYSVCVLLSQGINHYLFTGDLEGEGEEAMLMPIDDPDLLDEVFAEFCHQYEEYENSEDAMQLEV